MLFTTSIFYSIHLMAISFVPTSGYILQNVRALDIADGFLFRIPRVTVGTT